MSIANGTGRVSLLRERWLADVTAFVAAARAEGDEPETEGVERGDAPEMAFCHMDPIGVPSHYSDFNIRSRHFRVVETFFVERDASGAITGLVSTTGLRRDRRVLHVCLVIVRRAPDERLADRVRTVLAGACREALGFAQAVRKLRFTFVLDPSLGGPLGAHVPRSLIDEYDRAGLVEEARIANETAPGREAVLLTFHAAPELVAAAGEPAAAGTPA